MGSKPAQKSPPLSKPSTEPECPSLSYRVSNARNALTHAPGRRTGSTDSLGNACSPEHINARTEMWETSRAMLRAANTPMRLDLPDDTDRPVIRSTTPTTTM